MREEVLHHKQIATIYKDQFQVNTHHFEQRTITSVYQKFADVALINLATRRQAVKSGRVREAYRRSTRQLVKDSTWCIQKGGMVGWFSEGSLRLMHDKPGCDILNPAFSRCDHPFYLFCTQPLNNKLTSQRNNSTKDSRSVQYSSNLAHTPAKMGNDRDYLLSLQAVRAQATKVLEAARRGSLNHFDYEENRMKEVADYVSKVIDVSSGQTHFNHRQQN